MSLERESDAFKKLAAARSLSFDGQKLEKPNIQSLWQPGGLEVILASQAKEDAIKSNVVKALQNSTRLLESDDGSLDEDGSLTNKVKQTALDPLTDLLKGFLDEGHHAKKSKNADTNPLAGVVENQEEELGADQEAIQQELDRSDEMDDPTGSITYNQARNWRMRQSKLFSMLEVKSTMIDRKLKNIVSRLKSSLDNMSFITSQIERKYQRRLLGKLATKSTLK